MSNLKSRAKKVLSQNELVFTLARLTHESLVGLTSRITRFLGLNRLFSNSDQTVVRSIDAFDQKLQLIENSSGTQINLLGHHLNKISLDLPEVGSLLKMNPFSDQYLQQVLNMHQHIFGNAYDVKHEGLDQSDIQQRVRWQTPYGQPAEVVGAYLIGFGFLIKKMNLPLGSRILEIGTGEGSLSYHLAKMGYHLTCVEVNQSFSEITKAAIAPLLTDRYRVEVINEDILKAQLVGEYDAIIFYESFHHILHHNQLLHKLKSNLSRNGIIVFGAEPVFGAPSNAIPYPWGLNLAGEGLRSIRKFGWMELGFLSSYFEEMLSRLGLKMEKHRSFDSKWSELIIASRK